MARTKIIPFAVAILGAAFLAAYFMMTASAQTSSGSPAPIAAVGPVMEIEVAGEANGVLKIKLFEDVAPKHVERFVTLANEGAYDDVIFHRVIDGFMAQSGDVKFGKKGGETGQPGTGGSDYPDLPAEFSQVSFERGIVGMARSSSPNSANSQFFIMFSPAPHLNGQYTVVGQVVEGLDVLDAIKRGTGPNGSVVGAPDIMKRVTIAK